MTSVEKRRSSRKSGGRRKRSNGGYSDTSSTGSFQDETDREVSNLTDRAFRSLCIGDEAVYNDSDLSSSPPCSHREKQLALTQSQGQNRENREREELKRAAHDSFSLRMQQYGQEWLHAGTHRAEVHQDPHWEGFGEMMQERVSATFQHSLAEASRQEQSHSNGVPELSSHHRTSGSRISSLIRTFNSDGAGLGGRYGEAGHGPSWDKSALMSIQRELCEFTNSHSGDYNTDYHPTTGQFPYRDSNFYHPEMAAVAHMNSTFHGVAHSSYSMSSNINGNTHVFIHSEFSPFKVWRNHNRFPFQQEQVSGFIHSSHFPKWYETPMYKEMSQEAYPHNAYRFKERGMGYPTNNMVPLVPPSPPRSTSTSTVLQKAMAVEKRCESELMGHYTHRKRTQSLGTNRLPSQRPSTASPTTEMSRYVGETTTSVRSLQQKLKVAERGMMGNQHGALCSSDDSIPLGNNTVAVAPNVARSRTAPLNAKFTTPPSAQHAHRAAEVSGVGEASTSPQLIEHAPVRAESRGATPDVRMSGYRSRATSFLFNLKDNRKRVKNTYSPTAFKNHEVPDKPWPVQEPRDTVIDIPDYTGPDFQATPREGSGRVHAVANPYVNQYQNQNPDPSMASFGSYPQAVPMGQFSEYAARDYQRPHRQGETRYSSVFAGHTTENFTPNRLTNGQCLHDGRLSFAERGMTDDVEAAREDMHGFKAPYAAAETAQNTCIGIEPHFNETVGRNFTNVLRPQQLQDTCNRNVLSQDKWRQTSSQDAEKINVQRKKEISAPSDKEPQTQDHQRADTKRESLKLPFNKYKEQNQPVINKGTNPNAENPMQSTGTGSSVHKNTASVDPNVLKQQPQYAGEVGKYSVENETFYKQQPAQTTDKNVLQKYITNTNEDESKEDVSTPQQFTEQIQQAGTNDGDKTGQRKPNIPVPDGYHTQSLQQVQPTPQLNGDALKSPLSHPDPAAKTQVKLQRPAEVKAEQAASEHVKAQHTQAELAEAQRPAQVEQPKADSARLILAGQTASEEVGAEKAKAELKEWEKEKAVEAKEETKVVEQAETVKEMGSEDTEKQQLETKPAAEEPKQTGETGVKEEQGQQVKTDEADTRQKGNIQTPPVTTEQAKPQAVQEVRAEEGKGKVRAGGVEGERTETQQIQMEQSKDKQAGRQERKEEQTAGEQIQEQEKIKVDEGSKVKDDNKVEDVGKENKSKEHANQAGQINLEQNAQQEAKEAAVKKKVDLELTKNDSAKTGQAETRGAKAQLTRIELEKPEVEIAEVMKTDVALADVTKPELAKSEVLAKTETQTQLLKPEVSKVESAKSESIKPEVAKPGLAKPGLAKPDTCHKPELRKPVQPNTDVTNMEKLLMKAGAELSSGQQQVKGDPDKVEQVRTELAKAKAELAKIKEKMRGEPKEKVNNPLSATGSMTWDYVTNYEELKKHEQPTVSHQNNNSHKTDQGSDFDKITENSFKEVAQHEVSNDERTPVSPPAAAEREHEDRTKDKQIPKSELVSVNAENKEEVNNCKGSDVTDGHYVYSESLKQFTLSTSNRLPPNVENKDVCNAGDKEDMAGNLQKCDAVKEKNISQQRNSDLIKQPPTEKKVKLTEHTTVQTKDLGFTPSRALTQKERAQTKQEILTSKIKAHAEKEISAIKEKGLRDGLISKNSTKQFAGGQNINVRQRPPSQEVPKKHETSSASGNTTTKTIMEPAEIQRGPQKSSTPSSSNKTPATSTAVADPSVEHSQKQALEPPATAKEKPGHTKNTDEGRNKFEKNLLGVTSPLQNQEQPTKNSRAKQEIKDRTNSEKQKKEHEDKTQTRSDPVLHKKDDGLSQDKAGSDKTTSAENPEHKHETEFEASAPSISLVFQDQSKTSAVDDSLQIMGIMVTVRERKPSENYSVEANSTKEQMNMNKIKDASDQVSKVNESSNKVAVAVSKDGTAEERRETQKKNPTATVLNDSPKNDSEISSERKNSASKPENILPPQESTSVHSRPKTETRKQERVEKEGTSFINTAPAKNIALSGTQLCLDTKDSMNKKAENSVKSVKKEETKTTNTKENLSVRVENTGTDIKKNSSQSDAESLLKHENMMINTSSSNGGKVDSSNAPLLGERRQDTQVFSPPSITANQNTCVSPKIQFNQTHKEKNNEVDDLHIDSIAIRVVPAAAKRDYEDISEKPRAAPVLSAVTKAAETQQAAAAQRQAEHAKEEELGVQDVLLSVKKLSESMRNGNQQNNRNATGGSVQVQSGEPVTVKATGKSADHSKSEPMEGGYFQVQGAGETSDELRKGQRVEETLDSVSKGGGLPGSKPNKASPSSKSYKELHNEAYVLDPILRKTLESNATRVQHETTKKKECETEGRLAPKQSESVSERQRSQEKLENKEHQTGLTTTRESSASTKSEVKPKPRTSTIPEISALADYARLKVIVSEERENPIQELPRNKKEGFFPLIQTRHSRRPVFDTEPKEVPVKEQTLIPKAEATAKVNKEPKALVFPITEKEHQRTGMFKLGDKERQEKTPSDTAGVSHPEAKHAQRVRDKIKSPTGLFKNQGQNEQVAANKAPNPASKTTLALTAVSKPKNMSVSQQLVSPVSLTSQDKHERSLKDERTHGLDQDSRRQPTSPQENLREGNRTPRKDEAKTKEERIDQQKQERVAQEKEETAAKELEKTAAYKIEYEKQAEEIKKRIIEESRASLAEEERRAAQREEERRAKEREAIALKIKERREKQREAERRAEEEGKAKQIKENKAAPRQEEATVKPRQEEAKVKEIVEIKEDKKAAPEPQRRKATDEHRIRTAQEEQPKKAPPVQQERSAALQKENAAALEMQQSGTTQQQQQQRRAEQKVQQRRVDLEKEKSAAQTEQQNTLQQEHLRGAAQEKRRTQEEQQRRTAQEEQQRRTQEEQQRRTQEEQQRRTAQEEQQRKSTQVEQMRVALQKEQQSVLDKQKRTAYEEQQRRAIEEQQQRRAAQEDQLKRATLEEQQRRAAQEEQQKRAAQEKEQRKAVQHEQQWRAVEEQQQRRAAQERGQRRAGQEEQQSRAVQHEQQKRAQEEKLRTAALEEQRRKAALEEQQRRAALEEQQKRAAQEEQQRRAVQEEQQRRAALEEQQKRTAQEEQQRRAAQEEQQKRAALEEQQRRAAQEEQQKRAALEEQQRRAAQEEQQRRAAQEEQQRRAAQEEQQKQAKQREQQQRRAAEEQQRILQEDQQRRAAQREHSSAVHEQQRKAAQDEQQRAAVERQQTEVDEQKKKGAQVEEQKVLSDMRAKEPTSEERTVQHDPVRPRWASQERDGEMFPVQREKEEEQRRTAQMRDALQYYAINSTASEKKVKERPIFSPLPSQPKINHQPQEPGEDSGANTRAYRPHGSTSPAPTRSSTSSPALGVKPSMFRVKDNTSRGSFFTKPVKPRYHKNFGEDFRVGSPVDRASERGAEEEQEILRQGAGTPANSETRFNKLAAIKELSPSRPTSTSQEFSGYQPQHRPFSRRSIAMDEDDSRSVISNMSEGVESFATSASDLADIKGLYDYERPESACSYSSDMSRSMGKPPTVPPKSEKALERAKRLTSRRIKKELTKASENSPAGGETPLQEVSNSPPSASHEADSSNQHAVTYPHFSSPISLAHAPHGSSSSTADQPSSRRSVQASPHATGPISLALPHVTAAGTAPVTTTTAAGSVPNSTALKTVPRVPSSPTVYHANHAGPVTQYHIETGYPQSYPLTQRKVLQDLGSGQYYVVDVPVQVKTKTFFDPETGKYVQLNVRESGQSTARTQPQQTFPQPHLQNPMQVKTQQNQPQATTTAKASTLYHGYPGYSQGYQPALNSMSAYRSMGSGVPLQNQQSTRGNHSYGHQTPDMRGNSGGHHHSPEKTPYLDTVNDSKKTYNRVYGTHGSYEAFPECDTNRQLAGSSVCENENSAHTQYQPRDIITMGELEDFMEMSDW